METVGEWNSARGEPDGEAGGNSPSVDKLGSRGTAGAVENRNGGGHRHN